MFLDNPNNRIVVTDKLKKVIIGEREKLNISATKLAAMMDRPQSWIAQIENGRTKTIKQGDLVLLIATVLDINQEEADEYLMKLFGDIVPNTNILDSTEVARNKRERFSKFSFVDDKTDKEFRNLKKYIISAFNAAYESEPEETVKQLTAFCSNIKFHLPFMLAVMSVPFSVMENVKNSDEETGELYQKIVELFISYANKDEQRISLVKKSENDFDDEEETPTTNE